jgi:heme oxygenase
VIATLEIQKVADHINEIKKRKDLVEQLIHHDKKKSDKNVVQGINKKLTRRAHKKKQQPGVSDILFEDVYKQFELKHDLGLQFIKEIEQWILKTKASNASLSDLVDSLEDVYGDSDGIGLRSISAFKKLASQLAAYPLVSI